MRMKQNYFFAVVCSLFANMNSSVINVIVSRLPYEVHALKIFFFQVAFSVLITFPWIFRKGFSVLKTDQLKLHVRRAMIAMVSVFFFYTSLKAISSVDAVIVKNTSPFYVPLLAMYWLRESIPKITWPLIGLGFIGVCLVIGPFDSNFTFLHCFPLLAAVGYAYMIVSVSKLRMRDSAEQILLFYTLTVVAFLAPLIILTWQPIPLELWGLFAVLGVFFGIGQIAIITAYCLSMPGKLAPFIFAEVFFTYLLLHVFFGVTISTRDVLGASLIIGSALVMLWAQYRAKEVSAK